MENMYFNEASYAYICKRARFHPSLYLFNNSGSDARFDLVLAGGGGGNGEPVKGEGVDVGVGGGGEELGTVAMTDCTDVTEVTEVIGVAYATRTRSISGVPGLRKGR